MAVEEINAGGGIGGRRVELVSRDDLGTPEGAQDADRELMAEGVVAIIGHATSGQTIAGLAVTNPAHVVMLSPTATTPELCGIEHIREVNPQALPPRGDETILLVEDEPTVLEMAKLMLETFGYTVLASSTPGEALRIASEKSHEIHLLITDLVMPEMTGRDLMKNLTSICKELKCLFMSGYTGNVIAHQGVLEEGVHFIQKPFSKHEMAAKVREVLDSK